MRIAAESLVIRARAGDQNAVAMIMRVREGASVSRRAALAYELLRNFVKKNPVGTSSRFGLSVGFSKSSLTAIASSALKKEPKAYAAIVRWVEKLPTNLDRYAEAACLVADGKTIDAEAIRSIIPVLRGSVVVAGEHAVSFDAAQEKGLRITDDWEVRSDPRGNLRITPTGGHPIGFPLPGKAPVSSVAMFASAFSRATRADIVQRLAGPLPSSHRQPLRVGYVMGLAHAIQSITRRGVPIKTLSEGAAWELGE